MQILELKNCSAWKGGEEDIHFKKTLGSTGKKSD